jgi:hypothetical protein
VSFVRTNLNRACLAATELDSVDFKHSDLREFFQGAAGCNGHW